MSKRVSYILNLFIFLMVAVVLDTTIHAQEAVDHALAMQARIADQGIKLRWGPATSVAWRMCNDVGYMVTRSTLARDGRMLEFEERTRTVEVTPVARRPWQTEAEWQPLIEINDYAGVAAQALYGENFTLQATGPQDQKEMLLNAQLEEKNKFSFGLFAADQSFEVAWALGLGWIDSTAKRNENYLYRVYPGGSTELPIDTGYVYVQGGEPTLLPKVLDLKAEFSNLQVMLSWNAAIGNRFYTSYEIEQSFDGQAWGSRTETPFVPVMRTPQDETAYFADTLPFNNKPVFYRIRGKTIFGDYGPYSDVVHGSGKDAKPGFFPEIIQLAENDQQQIEIKWSFNVVAEEKISGFNIWRSDNGNDGFIQMNADMLAPTDRFYVDENPLPSNYYKIIAWDLYGRPLESFPAFTQLNDETPPAPPQNVRGRIAMNGDLIIVWDKNTEPDFMGNRVFLANHPEAEFTRVTNEPVTDGYYIYRVTLATLTEEVYVRVTALDYRQNSSLFSEIAKIARPDTIAPVAPRFIGYESTQDGIEILWENSPSLDVDRQELFRRQLGMDDWQLIRQYEYPAEIDVASYIDADTRKKEVFEYRIDAVDDANLRSESPPIRVQHIDDFIRDTIYNIQSAVDRKAKNVQINWDYPVLDDLEYFQVFRSLKDKLPTAYSTISLRNAVVAVNRKKNTAQYQFIDRDVSMNTEYVYQIKAKFADGAQSPLSQLISISY